MLLVKNTIIYVKAVAKAKASLTQFPIYGNKSKFTEILSNFAVNDVGSDRQNR